VRGVLIVISACALALSLAACGERSEPTDTSVRIYPVTVTGASGDTTVVQAPPQRILALGSEMAATLRALGAGGRTITSERLPTGGVPENVDLVTAWASSEQADALARAPDSGPVYVAADGSIEELEQSLGELGLLVARPITAREMVEDIDGSVREVTEQLGTEQPVTVFLDTGFFTTVSTQSLQGDHLAKGGGDNVAGAAPEAGPFDLRHLRQLDPRWYLATSDSGTTLKRLRRNPATRDLSAVRAGRFAVVPTLLLEPGPGVGEGVERIARILHPDAFR
jgi:ABC-type Fe3+-hydroxamate transport system substrate-binding protein